MKTECLHEGWQTSGSMRVVRMAYNLYCNGTPSIFDYDDAEEQVDECRRYRSGIRNMQRITTNVFCISSMQKMTDEFIKDECVKSLCTMLGVSEHEFFPHYVIVNEFLS